MFKWVRTYLFSERTYVYYPWVRLVYDQVNLISERKFINMCKILLGHAPQMILVYNPVNYEILMIFGLEKN